jgi:hypothetical protein
VFSLCEYKREYKLVDINPSDTKSGLTTPFIGQDNSPGSDRAYMGDMVRKAYLHPYLTSKELKTRYLCSSDRVESRRWHLLWLVSQQWTIHQASQVIGLNYDYAKEIVKAYNQQGEKAIANRRRQRTTRQLMPYSTESN